jgi:hypothetical protein
MRRFHRIGYAIAGLSLVLLAGCADGDWAHMTSYDTAYPAPVAIAASADVAPVPVADRATINYQNAMGAGDRVQRNCEHVARERASDVSDQGFDEATQREAHDRTYADCVAWKQGHADK